MDLVRPELVAMASLRDAPGSCSSASLSWSALPLRPHRRRSNTPAITEIIKALQKIIKVPPEVNWLLADWNYQLLTWIQEDSWDLEEITISDNVDPETATSELYVETQIWKMAKKNRGQICKSTPLVMHMIICNATRIGGVDVCAKAAREVTMDRCLLRKILKGFLLPGGAFDLYLWCSTYVNGAQCMRIVSCNEFKSFYLLCTI